MKFTTQCNNMYTIKKVGQVKDAKTKNGTKQTKSFVIKGIFNGAEAENWASFWVNPKVSEWKEGDEIECNVTSREYNGKTYWNGELPKMAAGYQLANNEIQKELDIIKDMLGRIISIIQPVGKKDNYPVMDETNNGEPSF